MPLFILLLLALSPLALLAASPQVESSPQAESTVASRPEAACSRIPDKAGRAGMAAVPLPAADDRSMPVVMMTGGANFPYAKPGATTPAERGQKVFYDEVLVMTPPSSCASCGSAPVQAGRLPYPIGYAAFAPSDKGMVVAGGCNMGGHLACVTRVQLCNGRVLTEALPDLPVSLAYPAFAVLDGQLYVMGGQEKPDSTVCLNRCFVLNLRDTDAGWKETAPLPGEGRMLAAAGVLNGQIYVAGGCSLHPDSKGQAERTYLKSILRYDPATSRWSEAGELPETLVGAANPMPAWEGSLYLICGDPGNYYRASLAGKAPAVHPGQNRTVYSLTVDRNASPDRKTNLSCRRAGENPVGIATAPAVSVGNTVYVISGETHPGIRTPLISTFTLNAQ